MPWNPTVGAYRAGAAVARSLPRPVTRGLTRALARGVSQLSPERRLIIERNLLRVRPDLGPLELRRAVRASFESYGRYWADSFRLPGLSPSELDGRFSYEGYEHIARARAAGHGPLMAIPHLGGWEWAAFWLTHVLGIGVTAVVEALEPRELFDWFVDYRESLGMHVVPLGPTAGVEVGKAVRRGDVVCLLADRDIAGTGSEVEFFGEVTTLPSGPALLALRTGAPLLPAAVYFEGEGIHTVVRPPIDATRRGRLRDDVARLTQVMAGELETLIRRAPEQWHLMEPNWPSDHAALADLAARQGRPA